MCFDKHDFSMISQFSTFFHQLVMHEITQGNVNVSKSVETISVTESGVQRQTEANNGQNCETL